MMDEKSLLSYNWYHQLEIPCSAYFETHKFCLMFEPEDKFPDTHGLFQFINIKVNFDLSLYFKAKCLKFVDKASCIGKCLKIGLF